MTVAAYQYDQNPLASAQANPLYEHDANYTSSFTGRGNPTSVTTPNSVTTITYDITGTAVAQTKNGVPVTITPDSTTNSLPAAIQPTGTAYIKMAQNFTYYPDMAVNLASAENNHQVLSMNYDSYGRPSSATLTTGATQSYSYGDTSLPRTQTVATANGGSNTQFVTQTLDGFGRVIRVDRGYKVGGTSTTLSSVNTNYMACGCSPLGKVNQVSMPYAPGGTALYATYAFDARGRTQSITAADGSAVTTYSYAGNNVTVTDPAGKWKTFTSDGMGNLTMVTEYDPGQAGSGANVTTAYTYDALNHLHEADMTRQLMGNASVTQKRIFNYDPTTQLLTSAINPENGTITYTYNGSPHFC